MEFARSILAGIFYAAIIFWIVKMSVRRASRRPPAVFRRARNGGIERRCMPWAEQRVQAVLDDINLPGITHDVAAAELIKIGVSHDRIRELLAGSARKKWEESCTYF